MALLKSAHGGNIREAAALLGIAPGELLDFSANINPLGLSPAGAEAIAHNLDGLIHYPDPNNTELGEITAQRLGVKPENLLFGNGAAELLFAVARLPGFTDVLIPAPGFSEYAEAATAAIKGCMASGTCPSIGVRIRASPFTGAGRARSMHRPLTV